MSRFTRVGNSRIVWSTDPITPPILGEAVKWDGSNPANTDLTGSVAALREGGRRDRFETIDSLATNYQRRYTARVEWTPPQLLVYDELQNAATTIFQLFDGGASGSLAFIDAVPTSGPNEANQPFDARCDVWPVKTNGPVHLRSGDGAATFVVSFRTTGQPLFNEQIQSVGAWGSGLFDEAVWV